jgi:hypothetical protein
MSAGGTCAQFIDKKNNRSNKRAKRCLANYVENTASRATLVTPGPGA